MAAPDVKMLAWLVSRFVRRVPLTHDERREVLHVARGLAAPDSARIERVPVEVIRTRRKAIYKKLRLTGSNQLVSALLALVLARLARHNGSGAGGRPVRSARGRTTARHRVGRRRTS